MASRSFTDIIASRLEVPTPYEDSRMRDVFVGGKRGFASARDFTNEIMSVTKRTRFQGDGGLGPLRDAMPDQLARGMTVVNTGFSTTDAQTDEIITEPIFVKPFPQGWEHDYVEHTPLFCNRVEPELTSMSMHTVASVQVLNFVLELGDLTRARNAIVARAGVGDELTELRDYFNYMIPSVDPARPDYDLSQDFARKWNYLGPMTSFKDAGVHSSNAAVRRSENAQRMLGFSVFNRAKVFNLFSPTLSKLDSMYFVCKEMDVSHLKNFPDPRGQAVVARTSFPATALQVVGFSDKDSAFPVHNSAYDPLSGPDSFKDPAAGDRDYVARAHRIAQEYKPLELDEETGQVRFRAIGDGGGGDVINDHLRSTPEIVYQAYMEGTVKKVGYARHFEGRRPSPSAIAEAHRSHDAMKSLQVVEIYHI